MKETILIDSHIHLHDPAYREDIEQVIERANQAGLDHMVTIACNFEELPIALSLAEKYKKISCTIGIHPHNVEKAGPVSVKKLIQTAHHSKIVAIGETGLDYYYENSPKEQQISSFRMHIEASEKTGLPLIIHARSADEDIGDILEEESRKRTFIPLMHCFSSGIKLAERVIALGGYFSFSGILTFKNADSVRSIAKMIPEDRLLIETDGPYLAPVPHRGKRNEPALIKYTLEKLAQIRGWDIQEAAHKTRENFYRLFQKVKQRK